MRISGDECVAHGDPIISAVGHEGRWSNIQLLQQGLDMRGVVHVLVGQIERDDSAVVGVDANVQFAPGAASRCSMLFKQSFARTTQFQFGAIDDQVISFGVSAASVRRSRSGRLQITNRSSFRKNFTQDARTSNKRFKPVVLRSEKSARSCTSFVALACGFLLIRSVDTA